MNDKLTENIKGELIAFTKRPEAIVYAVVTAVDEPNATISVTLPGGLELDQVLLRSIIKAGNRCVVIPKVNSMVLIGKIEDYPEFVVLAVEEIDKIFYIIGTVKMEMDDQGFLFAKGMENMQKLMTDFIDAILAERHLTNYGPTISLVPASVTTYTNLKTRVLNLFKNA